jgi:hypothetical protein
MTQAVKKPVPAREPPEKSAPKPLGELALLWRTWYSSGSRALDEGDDSLAVSWLSEALDHSSPEGDSRAQYVITAAALTYAMFRLSEAHFERSNDICLTKDARERYRKSAEQLLAAAEKHACSVLECAKSCSDNDLALCLARARATFVCASIHLRSSEFTKAAACFKEARAAASRLKNERELTEKILKGLISSQYPLGHYLLALDATRALQKLLSESNDRNQLSTWLLAMESDLLYRTGEYAEADSNFIRWRKQLATLDSAAQCSEQAAFGFAVFGRSRLATGYIGDADFALERAAYLHSAGAHLRTLLEIDVLLARSELSTRRCDFLRADDLMRQAEKLIEISKEPAPFLSERKASLCLHKGYRLLDSGQFEAACSCFASALTIADRECASCYMLVVPALLGIARTNSQRGKTPEALQSIHRALACLQQAKRATSPEMARAMHELAFAYVHDDKAQQAQPACSSAIRLLRISLRSQHPDEAEFRLTLSQSLSSAHHAEHALKEVEAARDLYQRSFPCQLFNKARAMRLEAEIRHARRELNGAWQLLACAFQLWQEQEQLAGVEHLEKSLIFLDTYLINIARDEPVDASTIETFKTIASTYFGTNELLNRYLNRRANLCSEHLLNLEATWLRELTRSEPPEESKNKKKQKKSVQQRIPSEYCPCIPWYSECSATPKDPCAFPCDCVIE